MPEPVAEEILLRVHAAGVNPAVFGVSAYLAVRLEGKHMEHVRSTPNYPQTQDRIERWHQTLKNRILLENHYLPGALEAAISELVDHDTDRRVHESLGNVWQGDAPQPSSYKEGG